jgi:hypothetical protein
VNDCHFGYIMKSLKETLPKSAYNQTMQAFFQQIWIIEVEMNHSGDLVYGKALGRGTFSE